MLFEKGMYAVAAVLIVFFGAFEPDNADVSAESPESVTPQLAQSSVDRPTLAPGSYLWQSTENWPTQTASTDSNNCRFTSDLPFIN